MGQAFSLSAAFFRSLLALILAAAPCVAQKFYPDDPLAADPKPIDVEKPRPRKLNDQYDFFLNTFAKPGEKSTPANPIRAQGVNTLGEVPDGAWYVNRHGAKRMSIEELTRGPDRKGPPSPDGKWKIIAAKNQGVTPGFTIVDSRGVRYILKFDPLTNPEMATAADVIGSKLFYAFGYHVPENYIVRFPADRLSLDPKTTFLDTMGKKRKMTSMDVSEILLKVRRDEDGTYRGVASLFLQGDLIGERRFHGTRRDDPNDIAPHEHRRDLRGLYVFCAWLNHDDSRSINSLDMVVEEGGSRYIRHYLIDFGAILGSASTYPNSPRQGYEYLFAWKPAARQFFSLGLDVPYWARAHFPYFPSIGRFESKAFDPDLWKPEYPNPAFHNRLPADTFWAARQVMRFTNDEIRAIVKTGQYSDPEAEKYVGDCLIERRDKIGKVYFSRVLPLDGFAVHNGRLEFEDLAPPHNLTFQWFEFDNSRAQKTPLPGAGGQSVPQSRAEYLTVEIGAPETREKVTVYLRGTLVVGIER